MPENMKFDNGYGIEMYARLRTDKEKITIEFYDARYDFSKDLHAEGIHGQFTGGSYYLETFMNIKDGNGLPLNGGVPDWTMDGDSVAEVKAWATGILQKNNPEQKKEIKMGTCTAVADGNRISFIISKEDPGYDDFAKVIGKIEKYKPFAWCGDVTAPNKKESEGIVLTFSKRV
jgi:hypothetical protein